MEKIQKALDAARESRKRVLGGQAASAVKQVAPAQSQPVIETGAVAQLWSELMPYEPNPDHLQKNRILTLNAEDVSNPFDVLRSKVFLMMKQNGWKRLAITSPHESCGKSTISCNLAIGLSRQRENRTMLFDADFRRPNLFNLMGRRPPHGITAMLSREVPPSQQMLCLRGNVALSLNTTPAPDSSQLMMAARTSEVLMEIEQTYAPDLMIFDMPPLFGTDGTHGFLKNNVDCALIVARAEYTKTARLDQCEREVAEQTNVLGVMLNNCRHIDKGDDYSESSY